MKKENIQNGIAIQSGKTTDSMEKLTKLCEQEAEKMLVFDVHNIFFFGD